jgi:hypothetical protein
MFIETEATPNPATLKFLPGRDVMGDRGTADFTSVEEAAGRSPLAERLFGLGDVARVFFGSDFVTVTKTLDADWQMLRPQVLGAIMEHYLAGLPILEGAAAEEHAEDFEAADQEIVAQIKELLDTRVRPAVVRGGYIPALDHNCPHDVSFENFLTYLRLRNLRLGLVINFGERLVKDGIHRVVNGL